MRLRLLLTFLLLCCALSSAQPVDRLAQAIAKAEGCYIKGTIPNRYHNCGDLKVVRNYVYPGQIGIGKGGHARFKDDKAGWEALEHQLDKIVEGTSRYSVNMSLQEFGKKYAQNYRVWAKNVAHNLGVEPTVYLWEILDVPPILEEQ